MLTRNEICKLIARYKHEQSRGWREARVQPGFVYAPYIPLMITPTYLGVDSADSTYMGVMTKYTKSAVSKSFYGVINLTTIPDTSGSGSNSEK